jgi:hypothetical protein
LLSGDAIVLERGAVAGHAADDALDHLQMLYPKVVELIGRPLGNHCFPLLQVG